MERSFVITGEHKGLNLFHFLKRVLPDIDHHLLKRRVQAGKTIVNGMPGDPWKPLRVGDVVEIEIPQGNQVKRRIEPPRVLYEDAAVIALDKPAGISAIRERQREQRTLVDAYLSALPRTERPRVRPKIVHRIDKDTSGVLVLAKSLEAKRALTEEFVKRRVEKSYLALVVGRVADDAGKIEAPLVYQKGRTNRVVVRSNGKPSVTDYQVKARYRGYTLLKVEPRTGRTHQIRVHLSHIGFPILCDELYGGGNSLMLSQLKPDYKPRRGEQERPLLARQALHAQALTFKSPATGASITVESPLPKDLLVALKQLDKYALDGRNGSIAPFARPW